MLLHPKGSKKKLLIIIASAVVVVGLLVGAAFWLKGSAEAGVTSNVKKARTDVTSALKALNTKLADTKLSTGDRIKAFDELEKSIAKTKSDTCKSESKNVMYGLSSAKNKCDDAKKKLSNIETAAQSITESAKDDQTLAGVLAPIKTADATNAAKQLEAWTAVYTNVANAHVSNSAMSFKTHLLAVAKAYMDAWKELTDADKAQNKVNYDAAVKKIDTAKDELSKIASDQTAAFKNNLTQFKQAVAAF